MIGRKEGKRREREINVQRQIRIVGEGGNSKGEESEKKGEKMSAKAKESRERKSKKREAIANENGAFFRFHFCLERNKLTKKGNTQFDNGTKMFMYLSLKY